MSDRLLIYGATGYSGRLITAAVLERGLRPVLSGRNEAKLAAMAAPLGLEYRCAGLADSGRLTAALRDMRVALHAAGPFSETAGPMLDACLRTGTHYLDISAEIRAIEALARRDVEARRRKIMIMPAVGFDVVPSDCLAAHVSRRLPGAEALAFGVTGFRFISRGSAKTLMEAIDYGVVRRDGVIAPVPLGSLQRAFDYGEGPRQSHNISWGDLATAYYTTGIPNIETYHETTPLLQGILLACRTFGWLLQTAPCQAVLKAQTDLLPEDPGIGADPGSQMTIVAEARDAADRRVSARLRTPEAYAFTGTTASAIASLALQGDLEDGFQTPGRVYGPDFVLRFDGVIREDLS